MAIRAQFIASDFIISAGCLVLKPSVDNTYDIILIHQRSSGEIFFPKGRKNIGESIEAAALREAYEETGYRCNLLPLPVPTMAQETADHTASPLNTEPLAISFREAEGGRQKLVYWFAAILEETAIAETGTQMVGEDFENIIVPLKEAAEVLTWVEDIALVVFLQTLLEMMN
ncbi:hypothetical protein MMC24_006373 [Lignoscripta atroalba]|nr:hypothetical protein [Lignoscripta atroalba]